MTPVFGGDGEGDVLLHTHDFREGWESDRLSTPTIVILKEPKRLKDL
jgi:hypothetical protein